MLARMDAIRAPALLARARGWSAGPLRALMLGAGGEPARAAERRAAREVQLPPAARGFLSSPDEAALDADLAWLAASGARIILCTDPDYPPLLGQSAGAPAALYVLGSTPALSSPQLAMVGSRSPTPSGRTTAHEFAAWFARAGLTVTSGLALGIDAASHEGALSVEGLTVAVCGTGLDRVYPRGPRAVADRRHRGRAPHRPPRPPPAPARPPCPAGCAPRARPPCGSAAHRRSPRRA